MSEETKVEELNPVEEAKRVIAEAEQKENQEFEKELIDLLNKYGRDLRITPSQIIAVKRK
jgi:hypothetical protein